MLTSSTSTARAAHQAAQHIDKPIYPKDLTKISPTGSTSSCTGFWRRDARTWRTVHHRRAAHAFDDRGDPPSNQIARRAMRTKRGDYQLFDAGQLSAAQHRSTAESYAAEGSGLRGDPPQPQPWLADWRRPACLGCRAHRRSWPAMQASFTASWKADMSGNRFQRRAPTASGRNPRRLPNDR